MDPSCAQAARTTWAIVADRDPARAATRSLRLYEAAFEDMILELSGETLAELNDAIHFDENGTQYPIDQVANDLYDAYLDPVASNGGWAALRSKVSASHEAQCVQQKRITMTKLVDRAHNAVRAMTSISKKDQSRWGDKQSFSPAMRRFVIMLASVDYGDAYTDWATAEQREALIEAFSDIAVGLFVGTTHSVVKDDLCNIQSLWYMLLGDKAKEFCPLLVILWSVYKATRSGASDIDEERASDIDEERASDIDEESFIRMQTRDSSAMTAWGELFAQTGGMVDIEDALVTGMVRKFFPVFQEIEQLVDMGNRFYNTVEVALSSDFEELTEDAKNYVRRQVINRRWEQRAWNDPEEESVSHQDPVYDILCVRPFREYTSGSGLLLKKGSELGNTFRGWADFQSTDNIIAKTHISHFTFWHASSVTNPKCPFLAEDIFCTNYIRGEGKKLLKKNRRNAFKERSYGCDATRRRGHHLPAYPHR